MAEQRERVVFVRVSEAERALIDRAVAVTGEGIGPFGRRVLGTARRVLDVIDKEVVH